MVTQADEQTTALKAETQEITAQSQNIVVTDDDGYGKAATFLGGCRALETEIKNTFGPLKKAAHDAHRAITSKEKEHLAPVQEAQKLVGRVMGDYQAELERVRLAKEREAQEEARKEAEAERAREALARSDAGENEEAGAIMEAPVEVPVVRVAKEAPKAKGTAVRTNWKFEIIDPDAIPREFLMPDEKKIRAVVSIHKGSTKVPGVRVWSESAVSARQY